MSLMSHDVTLSHDVTTHVHVKLDDRHSWDNMEEILPLAAHLCDPALFSLSAKSHNMKLWRARRARGSLSIWSQAVTIL